VILPPRAESQCRYQQCFISHDGEEGFEVVAKYLDQIDMYVASTLLVGVILKAVSAEIETPGDVLFYAVKHAKNVPGDTAVGLPGAVPIWENAGGHVGHGKDLLMQWQHGLDADTENKLQTAQMRSDGRRVQRQHSPRTYWHRSTTWERRVA
jgi:hypothetical protein